MSDKGARIDKWLWPARFFKTRGLATEKLNGGHVRLNGEWVKPSKPVECGDELTILREHEQFVVTVTGLAEKRAVRLSDLSGKRIINLFLHLMETLP